MTKIEPLNWLRANNMIYAAPNNYKFIYYIKSMEDGTFVLDQLDIIERSGTRTFHPTMSEAKACAYQLYTNNSPEIKS
jgi:phage antirepressor YoqD-like protein